MPSRSWTDDLPKCQYTNVAYYKQQTTESWDGEEFRCFYCRLQDDTCLYGLFDAHNGNETANFVLQRMAAEILLGQLSDKYSDEEIKEVLRNAFLSVEKAYIVSIDGLVAERTSLQYELPEGLSPEKLSQKCGDILDRLKQIDEKLSSGVTSVVALIHMGKLYVANIGNSRALLCKTDENCVLRVVQLSVDHSLSNEDELLRLAHLGLDLIPLRNGDMLGNQPSTRCLGNYLVKGLYRAFPDMKSATSEPVIAIPEVHGPIALDDSCRFLVLVSDGLYRNLQESTDTEQVNKRFAQMIVEQFRTQTSLKGVCQAVVDQTMSIYQEYCSQTSKQPRRNNRNTLLIRNFNFQLPNAPIHRSPLLTRFALNNNNNRPFNLMSEINHNSLAVPNDRNQSIDSPDASFKPTNPTVRFNPIVQSLSHNSMSDESQFESYSNGSVNSNPFLTNATRESDDNVASNQSVEPSNSSLNSQYSHSTDYSRSSTDTNSDLYPNNSRVPYDKDRKIEAYVDFSDYYANIERAKQNGLNLPSFLSFD